MMQRLSPVTPGELLNEEFLKLYNQRIRNLSTSDRLRLLALIAQDLQPPTKTIHRLSELRGLGKEIWQGVDAQQYVSELRNEWGEFV